MGVSLKDIFKNDEERLVENKRKTAIKYLVILSIVLVIMIIIVVVIRYGVNKNEVRRNAVTKDIIYIHTDVVELGEKHALDASVALPGTSLEEKGITLNINGVAEEFRYGYYMINPEDLKQLSSHIDVLELPNESYIVNYNTGDVLNCNGIKYNRRIYHSYDDLTRINSGQPALSDITIIIRTASDMEKMRQMPNGYFRLSSNIDMSEITSAGEGWQPIDNFKGTLDGRGYTISNLRINRPTTSNVGLFAETESSSVITNIIIDSANINGGSYTGALAGSCNGTVSHIQVINSKISGKGDATGGIVGSYNTNKISDCIVNGSVDGDNAVGGAIGYLLSGTVERVGVEGTVSASQNVGGLIGQARVSAVIGVYTSYAKTNVSGISNIGGLIGGILLTSNNDVTIKESYANGAIRSYTNNAGGMIGQILSTDGASNILLVDLYTTVSGLKKEESKIGIGGFIGDYAISSSIGISPLNCFWQKKLYPGEELDSVGQIKDNVVKIEIADKPERDMHIQNNFTSWNFGEVWEIEEAVSSPTLKWEKNFVKDDEDENK